MHMLRGKRHLGCLATGRNWSHLTRSSRDAGAESRWASPLARG